MRTTLFLVSSLIFLATGCDETAEQYTLNPDGRGKVTIHARFSTERNQLRDLPALLTQSQGVTAWKDASFALQPDGSVQFAATAYFDDISKVDFKLLGKRYASWSEETGTLVLKPVRAADYVFGEDDEDATPEANAKKPSEQEIQDSIKSIRRLFDRLKPRAVDAVGHRKLTAQFNLPGRVTQATNLRRLGPSQVAISVSGQDAINAFIALMHDEKTARLAALANAGDQAADQAGDYAWNKTMFGTQGPVQVRVTGTKPQFDYAAEVEAARQGQGRMLSALGITPANEGAAGRCAAMEWLKVSQISFLPERHQCLWQLEGRFKEPVVAVAEARLTQAVSDEGANLAPSQGGGLTPVDIRQDGYVVSFQPLPLELASGTTGLKRITGKLVWVTGGEPQAVDLGFPSLELGAKSRTFAAKIDLVEQVTGTNHEQVRIRLAKPPIVWKELHFLDLNGNRIEATWAGEQQPAADNGEGWVTYELNGPLPRSGRIEIVVYKDAKRHEAAFEFSDMSLFGYPRGQAPDGERPKDGK